MGDINSGYPILFGAGGDDDRRQRNEDEDAEPDSGISEFNEKWGWVANVDAVANTMRLSWDDVYRMPAVEFLNVVCYRRDKAEEERMQMEKWKKRN